MCFTRKYGSDSVTTLPSDVVVGPVLVTRIRQVVSCHQGDLSFLEPEAPPLAVEAREPLEFVAAAYGCAGHQAFDGRGLTSHQPPWEPRVRVPGEALEMRREASRVTRSEVREGLATIVQARILWVDDGVLERPGQGSAHYAEADDVHLDRHPRELCRRIARARE